MTRPFSQHFERRHRQHGAHLTVGTALTSPIQNQGGPQPRGPFRAAEESPSVIGDRVPDSRAGAEAEHLALAAGFASGIDHRQPGFADAAFCDVGCRNRSDSNVAGV